MSARAWRARKNGACSAEAQARRAANPGVTRQPRTFRVAPFRLDATDRPQAPDLTEAELQIQDRFLFSPDGLADDD